jgi:4-diphosphocytidyl-2-C-methyl-D-erythritol kinase
MKAYAKVNLSLDITGKLENGYHTLRSVMQAVDLFDEVTVGAASGDAGIALSITPESLVTSGIVPTDSNNLAWQAAALMAERFQKSETDITITIDKRIPVAAGLAGGSSDAAAVMLLLAELWNADTDLENLCILGATLGADIPFCLIANAKNNSCRYSSSALASSTAFTEGIGDILTPLPSPVGSLILVKPRIPLMTSHIFGIYDNAPEKASRPDTDGFLRELRDGEITVGVPSEALPALVTYMVNALEYAALSESPETANLLGTLKSTLPQATVFLSGSGPTIAAYFPESAEAEASLPSIQKRLGTQSSSDTPDVFFAPLLK